MLGAYGAGWDYLGLKGVVEKLLETARVADARFARQHGGHIVSSGPLRGYLAGRR